jgi:hypothetical protein
MRLRGIAPSRNPGRPGPRAPRRISARCLSPRAAMRSHASACWSGVSTAIASRRSARACSRMRSIAGRICSRPCRSRSLMPESGRAPNVRSGRMESICARRLRRLSADRRAIAARRVTWASVSPNSPVWPRRNWAGSSTGPAPGRAPIAPGPGIGAGPRRGGPGCCAPSVAAAAQTIMVVTIRRFIC